MLPFPSPDLTARLHRYSSRATRLLHPLFAKGTTRTLDQTTAILSWTTWLQARHLYARDWMNPLPSLYFTGNGLAMTAKAPIASRTPTVAVYEYLNFTRMRFKATCTVSCAPSRQILSCTLFNCFQFYFVFCRSNIRPGSEPYLISTIYSMLKKNWSPVCRPSPPSLPLATRLNPLNLPALLHFF